MDNIGLGKTLSALIYLSLYTSTTGALKTPFKSLTTPKPPLDED